MNTAATQAPPAKKGCSTIVVLMIATLTFVLGLLAGAGALFGYLKANEKAVSNLGLAASAEPTECPPPPECPTCPECETAAAGAKPSTYALVYPIEQTLRIEGKLDKVVLREHVIKQRYALQKCYQKALAEDPSIKGEISLQFTISNGGEVIAAVSRQDTVKNEPLKKCVIDKMKSWEFPEDEVKSKLAVVKFDVLFTPIGGSGP